MTNPRSIRFTTALVNDEWAENVVLTVSQDGLIANILTNAPSDAVVDETIVGTAIPGMPNVHSHAFQRAFAGLSESRTGRHDSFWTWRKLMYDFVERLTPEEIYKTARGLYYELARFGYTWVGEFHYVHNSPSGLPYEDRSCLSDALIHAARDVGIGICLLPVLYQRGGFADEELAPAQRRFSLSEGEFLNLVSDLRTKWGSTANVEIGIAFHSLRAVSVDVIRRVTEAFRRDQPDGVIHIHVAEQTKEVDGCLAATGRRPVEYLLSEVPVDNRWCLIHATHLKEKEIHAMANSGATAGLCPTTEANLGDGIFSTPEFVAAGGRFAIGSDSHVCVNPRSELRLIEYGQRLTRRSRAVLCDERRSVGRYLYDSAASGGAVAIGIEGGVLKVGSRADLVVLDPSHPAIDGSTGDRLIDRYVFCDAGNPVSRTMVGGNWVKAFT